MKLFQHLSYFSSKSYVPEVGESSNLNTSKNREDNTSPLSLFSLSSNVREVLQSVIASGELDLSEVDLNQINMLETWVLVDACEHIRRASGAISDD